MNGGYWAVLPSEVRYDARLSQTAKLLYAEVSALAQANGYCWATDEHLAETLGCSVASISRGLRLLDKLGYIRREKTTNAKGTERHIYCGMFAPRGGTIKNEGTLDGTLTGDETPIVKNDETPPSTLYNKNNKRGNTRARELVPEINAIFDDLCGNDRELRELVDDFCTLRAELHKPITTKRMANILAGRLYRFSEGDHRLMTAMLEKAIDGRWQSVYALKPDELPEGTSKARTEAADVKEWRPGDD